MSVAGAARAQVPCRPGAGRSAHRRMHGPAHRHRYPEPGQTDRRQARIELARGRRSGVPHKEELIPAHDPSRSKFALEPELVAIAALGDVEEKLIEGKASLAQALLERIG